MESWSSIAQFQPALTPQDKEVRDHFIEQYFLDFNSRNAIIRLGYNPSYADHMARQFMSDSYVLNGIEQKKRQGVTDEAKDGLKSWITAELMSRAQYNGPGSTETAKISALKVLIDLHGLAPGTGSSKTVTPVERTIEGEFEETEMSLEELQAECEKRGLPTIVFKYEHVS